MALAVTAFKRVSSPFSDLIRSKYVQRQTPKDREASYGGLPSLRRVAIKIILLEFSRKHTDYKSSSRRVPCESEGENPIMAPTVGTRSID